MINPFQTLIDNPALLFTSVFILGLLVGSFLNVVILRLPKMLQQDWKQQCTVLLQQGAEGSNEQTTGESEAEEPLITLSSPNSTCPQCGHGIKPWENIPVISYLFLRGKCSQCKTHISIRYPLVELATAIISVVTIQHFGFNYTGGMALILAWVLIALTMIDADTQLLPDNLTLPLLWLGLIANYFGLFTNLGSALWGAVFGYLSLWSVYQAFKILTGKEGMGYGDFKLLGALGAWMGWQYLPIIILLSSVVGAAIGIGMILIRGKDKNIPMPFGPYLAIAGWIALLYGSELYGLLFGTPL